MRIAFDARVIQDHFPGIGRYALHLLEAIAAADPGAEIVAFYDPNAPRRDESLACLQSQPNISLCPAPPIFALQSQLIMRRLIGASGADLAHSPYYVAPYFSPAPLIVTIYDLIPLTQSHQPPRGRDRWLYLWLNRLAAGRAAHVITASHHAAAEIRTRLGVPPARLSVIPAAPAPDFQPASRDAVASLRARLDLNAPYLLHVGINKPHKNQAVLIKAFARLCHEGSAGDAVLALAGPLDPRYPDPRHVTEAAGIGERVRVLGPVTDEDLVGLYSDALAFVFPSLAEGFGLPLLEAMACGAPIACSDRSPLTEVAGPGALTFDPGDPAALAAVLRPLLHDAELRAAQRVRSLARAAAFSWTQAAEQTLAVYRRVLGNS